MPDRNGLPSTGREVFVLPSANPDLDGVACAVGLAEWYTHTKPRRAIPVIFGEPDPEAQFYTERFPETNLRFDPSGLPSEADLIYVDASSLHGFPRNLSPERVTEVVDHRLHGQAQLDFPNAQLSIELVGSAATLIAERFVQDQVDPSRSAAALLFGAIQSNTQCLRGAVTTQRDIAASEWATSFVPDNVVLLRGQFVARRAAILNDPQASITSETKQYCHFDFDYAVAQLELAGGEEWFAATRAGLERIVLSQPTPTMLNVVDVSTARSVLFVPSGLLRNFTSERTGLEFDGDHTVLEPATLRKQIVDAIAGLRPLG